MRGGARPRPRGSQTSDAVMRALAIHRAQGSAIGRLLDLGELEISIRQVGFWPGHHATAAASDGRLLTVFIHSENNRSSSIGFSLARIRQIAS